MRDGEIVARRAPCAASLSRFRDLLGVAWTGLTARKVRTLLIMLGPIVGVAAMVGAVGLTESAKGDLKQKLSELGTNLIIAQAGGTFGSQNPTFPDDVGDRVEARVDRSPARRPPPRSTSVVVDPRPRAARLLPGVPGARARGRPEPPSCAAGAGGRGRWFGQADLDAQIHAAVIGESSRSSTGTCLARCARSG